jgi:hypothetical protein
VVYVVESTISLEWIKEYIDQLLGVAGGLQPGPFQDAILRRIDSILDLVKAWKERKQ